MKIIDKYLIKEYLKSFLIGFIFFSALVIIVRLLDKDIKHFDDGVSYITAVKIILYQAPRRIMEIVPVSGFVAIFFILGRMVKSNEFVAMKAGGISVYRILAPVIVVTLLICIAFSIFYDRFASPAYHEANVLQKKVTRRFGRNLLFKGKENRIFYSHSINLEEKSIYKLTIWESDAEGELNRTIYAKQATWTPTHWELKNGNIRLFDGDSEVGFETFEDLSIERHEEPELFIGSNKDPKGMTIKELKEQIAYKQDAGQITRIEQVKLHHKRAYPYAAVVVVLLGAPIAIRFGKAGFFAGLVIAFFLVFIYWALSFATLEGLSENGKLHPFLACWGTNIIYGIVGCILMWRTPK
ncbi:LptF/LptG family permease [Candidatus Poribacteria bacterium]|nr:LptF/LptG family permease [Candidatus Poribacteria bacterium]